MNPENIDKILVLKDKLEVQNEITEEYLLEHPNEIFVFGDNTWHKGTGGAAKLRHLPNTYGFITKRTPKHNEDACYEPWEYAWLFKVELDKLIQEIESNPDKIYLISKVGAGLANDYGIFEQIIEPTIKPILSVYTNVRFLW